MFIVISELYLSNTIKKKECTDICFIFVLYHFEFQLLGILSHFTFPCSSQEGSTNSLAFSYKILYEFLIVPMLTPVLSRIC